MRKHGVSKESAKRWADKIIEDYKKTEEYQKEKAEIDEEFKNFFLYGTSTVRLNSETLKEICEYNGVIKVEELSVEQIIDKFGDLITEKDIENLKKLRDGK